MELILVSLNINIPSIFAIMEEIMMIDQYIVNIRYVKKQK